MCKHTLLLPLPPFAKLRIVLVITIITVSDIYGKTNNLTVYTVYTVSLTIVFLISQPGECASQLQSLRMNIIHANSIHLSADIQSTRPKRQRILFHSVCFSQHHLHKVDDLQIPSILSVNFLKASLFSTTRRISYRKYIFQMHFDACLHMIHEFLLVCIMNGGAGRSCNLRCICRL